eukprot:4286829-Pleurochrysis_carterae.AAC.1
MGTADHVATGGKYLPVGWATLECGTTNNKPKRAYVQPLACPQVHGGMKKKKRIVQKRLRLPYARAQASAMLPLVKR